MSGKWRRKTGPVGVPISDRLAHHNLCSRNNILGERLLDGPRLSSIETALFACDVRVPDWSFSSSERTTIPQNEDFVKGFGRCFMALLSENILALLSPFDDIPSNTTKTSIHDVRGTGDGFGLTSPEARGTIRARDAVIEYFWPNAHQISIDSTTRRNASAGGFSCLSPASRQFHNPLTQTRACYSRRRPVTPAERSD